jgi:hypothetical protein
MVERVLRVRREVSYRLLREVSHRRLHGRPFPRRVVHVGIGGG